MTKIKSCVFCIAKSLLMVSMLAVVGTASAAPGDLDTTFGGGDGWVSTAFREIKPMSYVNSVIQQADGKLVAAGYSYNGNDNDIALARYNADGSLDVTFNGVGKVTTIIGVGSDDRATAVIQQADGKLVVTGRSDEGADGLDLILVRYNDDGSLDTTFNGTGKVTAGISSEANEGYSLIQQSDGKLVVAGYRRDFSTGFNSFALVRYNSNGSIDTTFNGGIVITDIGTGNSQANSVIQQADGKLVAAGSARNASNYDFAVARYNLDGSLDTAFNTTGKVTTDIAGSDDGAAAVIQQSNGKLVAAGYSNISFALVRYSSDGSLDTGFSGDGKVTTPAITDGSSYAHSVIQQADGKLVAAGSSGTGGIFGAYHFALVRYNSDGSLDTSFSGDGKELTSVRDSYERANAVIQQADGKLVAAGYSASWGNDVWFALTRYNSNGSLDASFDGDGKVTTAIAGDDNDAQSTIQQSDGKLVVAGSSYNGSDYDFALVRYNANGSLDTTFNVAGKVTTDIGGDYDDAYSVIQQSDGKLVVAGSSYNGSDYDFALVRYNANGSLDTAFSGDGKVTTDIGSDYNQAYSVIQQSDGKLVVAGSSYNGNDYDFALVRYNTNGSLDTTFSGDGKVTTDIGSDDNEAYSLIQQSDGKLVVAGNSYNGNDYDFALVRYNSNGSLDTTFNATGKVTTDIGSDYNEAYSLIQQSDGKLVAAGNSYNGSDYDFALVRYAANGSLDTTFNITGKVTTDIDSGDDMANSVIQQSDGKLVVAGTSYSVYDYGGNYSHNYNFALVRYNSGGSLDTTFSYDNDGKVIFAPLDYYGDDYAASVIQQVDGKLVVAGYSDAMPSGQEFVVARFERGPFDPDSDSDGLHDASDNCPLMSYASQADTDNDGVGNACDSDMDGDTIDNAVDNCPLIANYWQIDTDSDGAGDECDSIPTGDTDGDGIDNAVDNCPLIFNPTQMDADNDYIGNECDATPTGTAEDFESGGIVSFPWALSGDAAWTIDSVVKHSGAYSVRSGVISNSQSSILEVTEITGAEMSFWVKTSTELNNFLVLYVDGDTKGFWGGENDWQKFTVALQPGSHVLTWAYYNYGSATGGADAVWVDDIDFSVGIADTDGDSILDVTDNCPMISNTTQTDTDSDGVGDACDSTPTQGPDTDNDGVINATDNCPLFSNTMQTDTDSDGVGDACDSTPTQGADTDNDSVADATDNCPLINNSTQTDTDGDGVGNACDSTPTGDTDGDGVDNTTDNCPLISNASQTDTDSDGVGDLCETATEDFESGGFTSFPSVMWGDAAWTIDSTIKHAGAYAARSGVISHNQYSVLEVTEITGAEMSFWFKTSSELNYDYLNFYVDFNWIAGWSGENNWQKFTTALTPGSHMLAWEYNKDGSVSRGADAVWVDDIDFGVAASAPDTDSDIIPDATDNCPSISNTNQLNMDADIFGDACDGDIDGDGAPNGIDADPLSAANAAEIKLPLDGTYQGPRATNNMQVF